MTQEYGQKGSKILLKDLIQALKSIAYLVKQPLWSIMPPYKKLEGILIAKESKNEGQYFVLIASEIIEVDSLTIVDLLKAKLSGSWQLETTRRFL